MERQVNSIPRLNSGASSNGDVFEPSSSNAKQRSSLVGWLNSVLPDLNLPINASDEELRTLLVDGTALCRVLNKLKPGSVAEDGDSVSSSPACVENVLRFLSGMDQIGLPRFQASDLKMGSMKIVLDCLLTLQTHFMPNGVMRRNGSDSSSRSKVFGERPVNFSSPSQKEEPFRMLSSPSFGEDKRTQRGLRTPGSGVRTPASGIRTPVTPDPSSAVLNLSGSKFHEVFQLKHGSFADIPAARITEMMKSNSMDNAPTQSLLSVVNGILDESIERKNGEIPHRVACLLRKVVQEIERRVATQAEHLRVQSNLFKTREEKYKSRIRVLEALATGTSEETQIVMNQLQQFKSEKDRIEEKKKSDDNNQEITSLKNELGEVRKMMMENNDHNKEISALKQELEVAQKRIREIESSNQEVTALKQELETTQRRMKENESNNQEVTALKQELETTQRRMKDNESNNQEVTALKQELETAQRKMKENESNNQEVTALKQELETAQRKMKENESNNLEVTTLKQELETSRRSMKENGNNNQELEALKEELESARKRIKENDEHVKALATLKQENDEHNKELAILKQENDEHNKGLTDLKRENDEYIKELAASKKEIEMNKKLFELQSSQSQEAKGAQQELEKRLKEVEKELNESTKRANELEALSKSKSEWWNKKENLYHIFTEFQLGALRELRFASQSIRQEVVKTEKTYAKDYVTIGSRIKELDDAAKSYYTLLNENRKLHNELQELKGNIRVYCRVRPFLPGQKGKQSCVEYVGENGELIVMNPAKQGKEARRSFKFNKVYGPTTTQGQVYTDTQALVQSVLDGYNVCIFAYGQTGSGKTYTMTGPTKGTEEEWGVNYRALNDLFRISQSRASSFKYEVSVQMVEIYNEQIRDLLATDASQRKVGVLSTSQPNGLAVPDANILPVNCPQDVLKVMDVGQKNRAQASTSMNERSSRSHSIVSIHARGTDLKSGSTLRASLHLVDLAGSERIDRSEVTGDRLKEAQHINKSLSALGDVIFALAQKNSHVPYRNSKLTQVLQSSLGGQAKTLMFVQLNPDGDSFSESLSTLKFAERVSGVELGAAKSSKDGRDVRELMEQVASLKDTIAKKDEEIERLNDKRYGSTNSHNDSSLQRSLDMSSGKVSESAGFDHDECAEGPEGSPKSSQVSDEPKTPERTLPTRIPQNHMKVPRESLKGSTGLAKSNSASNLSAKPTARF